MSLRFPVLLGETSEQRERRLTTFDFSKPGFSIFELPGFAVDAFAGWRKRIRKKMDDCPATELASVV